MTTTYYVTSGIPVGTPVLPIVWPDGADDGSGGTVVETTAKLRAQGLIEVYWNGKDGENPCTETVQDVILDTPANRAWLLTHRGKAWAMPSVDRPTLDTDRGYRIAAALLPGQRVDLEGDPYAEADDLAAWEYAEVESVERETPECVVVHTSQSSFGCPPSHLVKLAPDDSQLPYTVGVTVSCERLGYFSTHDEAAEFIGTLPDHLDGIYYLDGPERKD